MDPDVSLVNLKKMSCSCTARTEELGVQAKYSGIGCQSSTNALHISMNAVKRLSSIMLHSIRSLQNESD